MPRVHPQTPKLGSPEAVETGQPPYPPGMTPPGGVPGQPHYVHPDVTPTPVAVPIPGRPITGGQPHVAPPFLHQPEDISQSITALQGSVNTLMGMLTPEQQIFLRGRSEFKQAADNYEESVTPKSRAWKIVKWGGGILLGSTVAIFGAGVAWNQTVANNATKADIEDHTTTELAPVKVQVEKNTTTISGVKVGVDSLVNLGRAEAVVDEAQQVAEEYRQEHREKITEWAASKAAGHRVKKPERRKELVDAELEVRRAQKDLLKVK